MQKLYQGASLGIKEEKGECLRNCTPSLLSLRKPGKQGTTNMELSRSLMWLQDKTTATSV